MLQLGGLVFSQRRDQLHLIGPGKHEIRRQDTDDGEGASIKSDRPTDDFRISSKTLLPQSVCKQGHLVPSFIVFLLEKITAQDWLNPEQGEQGSGSLCRGQLRWLVESCEVAGLVVVAGQVRK
jgi:hypothetical protein